MMGHIHRPGFILKFNLCMPFCDGIIIPSGTSGEGQKTGSKTSRSFKTSSQTDAGTNNAVKICRSHLTAHINGYLSNYNVTLISTADLAMLKKMLLQIWGIPATSKGFGGYTRESQRKISL